MLQLGAQTKNALAKSSIQDADGEFLLIESAMHIPDWLKPETAENRVEAHREQALMLGMDS